MCKMNKDQVLGALLLLGGVVGILLYGWLVFFSQWGFLLLQLTGFIAITGILGILAWIGYTLATTPAPAPFEDLEKAVEEEVKADKSEGSESKPSNQSNPEGPR